MRDKTVGFCGAGTMGNGIAQAFAMSGFRVVLTDVATDALERATATIGKSLDRLIAREQFDASERGAVLERISTDTALRPLGDCAFVVEAATEREAVKTKLFRELDAVVPGDAVLASNTSSISLTRLAATCTNPERVVGMHFFNPVPVMRLVEVVRALQTADDVAERVCTVARELGKEPVVVRDSPGFVANRILVPMINEACFVYAEGLTSAEEIDTVMRLGANHPMGPLALADLVGLDVCLEVLEVLHEGLGDPKYRPAPILRQMVDAGYLGRKSGRGFYSY